MHTPRYSLFPNNILTPLIPNPNLMKLPSRDIDPRPNAKGLFLHLSVMQLGIVLGVGDSQRSATDQMSRDSAVCMW